MLEETQICPDFSQLATSGMTFCLSEAKKPIVLYFYPRDSTPGCTSEAIDFREHFAEFTQAGFALFGISRDSLASHEKFKSKFTLPFELIADVDEKLCTLFDVIREKNMYGKKVRGIERSTFVIDADCRIIKAWRKVKVEGHVAEVLSFVTR